MEAARPSTAGEEELQLQLALAMSKEEHEEDERKKRSDDVKLHMALEESKKEEVKRHFLVLQVFVMGNLVRIRGSFSLLLRCLFILLYELLLAALMYAVVPKVI